MLLPMFPFPPCENRVSCVHEKEATLQSSEVGKTENEVFAQMPNIRRKKDTDHVPLFQVKSTSSAVSVEHNAESGSCPSIAAMLP
jgi:hypothetical protein